MTSVASLAPAIVAGLVLALGATPVLAAPAAAPKAVGTWSMVPQAKDSNGDGFIDGDGGVPRKGALSRVPASAFIGAGNHRAQPNERLINGSLSWYLGNSGFPVRLDACRSQGKDYRWTITPPQGPSTFTPWKSLSPKSCSTTIDLPEGRYGLNLQVRSGAKVSRTALAATVENHLVVVLGDSYASGEGNPRNVEAWLAGSGAFTPYWDSDTCHRSTRSGPAQAALALENTTERSSVTFVDVSCSGATVDSGILGAQRGAGQQSSQVEQARSIVGDRQVDLVVLSVGGNDVGFTSILGSCALLANCPVSKAMWQPLAKYPTVQDGVQTLTGELTADYARIAACLGGSECRLANRTSTQGLAMAPRGAVLPVLYPDITRATDGQPCTYLTLSSSDFGWARDTILEPSPQPTYGYVTSSGSTVTLPLPQGTLNGQIAATGTMLGWRPVVRAWNASGDTKAGHGVCADDAWVFGLTALTAMPEASFHPNPAGQAVLGKAIAGALTLALPGRG